MYYYNLSELNELPVIEESELFNIMNQLGEYEYSTILEIDEYYYNGVILTDPMDSLAGAISEIYNLNNIINPLVVRTLDGVVYVINDF